MATSNGYHRHYAFHWCIQEDYIPAAKIVIVVKVTTIVKEIPVSSVIAIEATIVTESVHSCVIKSLEVSSNHLDHQYLRFISPQ